MSDELGGGPDLLSAAPERRWRWAVAAAVLVGVAVGALVMHQVDDSSEPPPPAATGVDVRVSLGAHAGDVTGVDGDPVVSVPLVLENLGSAPLTLSDIRVDGPGATLVVDPELRPRLPLPATLAPGLALNTRIAIRSSCREALRPVPVVTLVVIDDAGLEHDVSADIPGFAAVWGQTLAPLSCATTVP